MQTKPKPTDLDDCVKDDDELVHLARLALSGRTQDVQLYLQRVARRHRKNRPDLAAELIGLLRENPTRSSPLRRESAQPVPIDSDSSLRLVRVESPDPTTETPILELALFESLASLVEERRQTEKLLTAGITPAKSALLVGPPGVGKSMTVRWLASQLELPLLTLDLSAVISSFLGRTGSNIRRVLDFAKQTECVLFLDEFDAIAKKRNDQADVGELKRLVTVLLQEIDDWPYGSMLVAATNHPELLDPAVWRRFDTVFEFGMPTEQARKDAVRRFSDGDLEEELVDAVAAIYTSQSTSEIERSLMTARRATVLTGRPFADVLIEQIRAQISRLSREERRAVAELLKKVPGLSQRQVAGLTGVARDTLRKTTQEHGASE
jgi:SpoVK/Ycf46/Vps4 family AAA+-type ATPase